MIFAQMASFKLKNLKCQVLGIHPSFVFEAGKPNLLQPIQAGKLMSVDE